MIHLKKLKKVFDKDTLWTLDEVSLYPGLYLLLGRNGSGKSTFLQCLSGLEFCESEVFSIPSQVAYLPESYVFPPFMKENEWMRSLLGMAGISARSTSKNRFLSYLSKGQKQQYLLEFILQCKASVILLDEPFSGLDPWARQDLLKILPEPKDHICLISTHDFPYGLLEKVSGVFWIKDQVIEFSHQIPSWVSDFIPKIS